MKVNSIDKTQSFKSRKIALTVEQKMARDIKKIVRMKKSESFLLKSTYLSCAAGLASVIFVKGDCGLTAAAFEGVATLLCITGTCLEKHSRALVKDIIG